MHWLVLIALLVILVLVGRAFERRRVTREAERRRAAAEACLTVATHLGFAFHRVRDGTTEALRGFVDGMGVRLAYPAVEHRGAPFLRLEVDHGVVPRPEPGALPPLPPPLALHRDRIMAELTPLGDPDDAERLEALVHAALDAGRRLRSATH